MAWRQRYTDPLELRARAEELRARAAGLYNIAAREAFLRRALDYELLAARIESRGG